MSNIAATTQHILNSFAQGDIPAILAVNAPNVEWVHPGDASIVPFAGTFKNIDGAIGFFTGIGQSVRVTAFEPRGFSESGNVVHAEVYIAGTGIATGKTYENVVDMAFTYNNEGQLARYEAFVDPTNLENALRA
jgi:ketosteroid isomerase-like protein